MSALAPVHFFLQWLVLWVIVIQFAFWFPLLAVDPSYVYQPSLIWNPSLFLAGQISNQFCLQSSYHTLQKHKSVCLQSKSRIHKGIPILASSRWFFHCGLLLRRKKLSSGSTQSSATSTYSSPKAFRSETINNYIYYFGLFRNCPISLLMALVEQRGQFCRWGWGTLTPA